MIGLRGLYYSLQALILRSKGSGGNRCHAAGVQKSRYCRGSIPVATAAPSKLLAYSPQPIRGESPTLVVHKKEIIEEPGRKSTGVWRAIINVTETNNLAFTVHRSMHA